MIGDFVVVSLWCVLQVRADHTWSLIAEMLIGTKIVAKNIFLASFFQQFLDAFINKFVTVNFYLLNKIDHR